MPIVEDDSNFQDSAPALFGTEFAKKSKDLVDQVKAMRVPLTSRREQKPFTSKDGDRHSDRFRCIPYGMGCNQLSTKDWRSLVC